MCADVVKILVDEFEPTIQRMDLFHTKTAENGCGEKQQTSP